MSRIIHADIEAVRLEPYESEGVTVLEGAPSERRYLLAESNADGRFFFSGVLEVQPSKSRFRVEWNETILVLEGSVTIEAEDGDCVQLSRGQAAVLSPGYDYTFTYPEPFKEFFVVNG